MPKPDNNRKTVLLNPIIFENATIAMVEFGAKVNPLWETRFLMDLDVALGDDQLLKEIEAKVNARLQEKKRP